MTPSGMAKTRMPVAGQQLPVHGKDVRGLGPVKEAMRARINVLVENNELAAAEIAQVITAGASGIYLLFRCRQQLCRDLLDQLGYNPK
jgi:uncharacterized 2Fe-2S/4Fe-4S cluster protein (DUF4445 family)